VGTPPTIADFEPWLTRWRLTPDGEPFRTGYTGNRLLFVRRDGEPAVLKLSDHAEERRGAEALAWWSGAGAVRVLAAEFPALLVERASGPRVLAEMARGREDEDATRILCAVAERLHAPRPQPWPAGLAPLPIWLRALGPAAAARGGVLAEAQAALESLLAEQDEVCVLHGDLHHENVLDGGDRGWLAIDPKGITGPRGYDYANILCNPDPATALSPGRLARQAAVIAEAARLPRTRVLRWTLVHAAVAGVWCEQDGFDPRPAREIAGMARAALTA
jgi:streptomycin 6-kinase